MFDMNEGDGEGGGDMHHQSFDLGNNLVRELLPKIFGEAPVDLCAGCLGAGAVSAAVEYCVFMSLTGGDDEMPDDLSERLSTLVATAAQEGFNKHADFLKEQDEDRPTKTVKEE